MTANPLGIDVDDLRMSPKDGFRAAAESGFDAVAVGAMQGELAPEALGNSGRRHLRRYVHDLGLTFASLTADLPSHRLTDAAAIDERVARTRRVLELSREINVPVVTTGVGVLTHPESGLPSPIALAALRNLGEYADSRGVILALRPTGDSVERLQRVLDELACPAVRLCLDPASALMAGTDPLSFITRFPSQLAIVHARDGTVGGGDGRSGRETALGEGDADWPGIMNALREADYGGTMILRRVESQRPLEDLMRGRDFMRRLR